MKLLVKRTTRTGKSTIGELYVDGVFEAYTLEPVDRGLSAAMSLSRISGLKVAGATAIPTGTYAVTQYYSPEHRMMVPLINNVPGFAFVEIHVGNYPADTKACLLPGTQKAADAVLHSRDAIARLYPKIFNALAAKQPVTITYQ